ncbi:hypothetical protein JCM19992_35080 [Thermostilla marina]
MSSAFDPYHAWFGIPPSEQPPNYYRLLGLALFESDPNVIEAAADQRLAFLRTKTGGAYAAEASRLMNEVTQARLTLSDPARRQAYDRLLQQVQQHVQGVASLPGAEAFPQIRTERLPATQKAAVRKRGNGHQTTLVVGSIAVALLVMIGVVALMMNMERYEPRPVEETAQANTAPAPKPETTPPAAPETASEQAPPEEPAPAEPPQEPTDSTENPFQPVEEPETPEVPVVTTSLEYPKAREAVVTVVAFSDLGETRATGVLLEKPRVVVTTHGAVEGAQRVQLEFANGTKTVASRFRVSLGCDLALLKPAQIDGLPEGVKLAGREPPEGEGCFIIPAGQGGSPIIESEIMAYLPIENVRTLLAPSADQTELALPRWNGKTRWLRAKLSGGVRANGAPVFNADGELLGVVVDTTGLLTDSALAITAENIEEQLENNRPFTPMVSFAPVVRMDVRPAMDAQNSIVPAFMSVDHVRFPTVALPNGERISADRVAPPENWASSIEQGYERLKQFFDAFRQGRSVKSFFTERGKAPPTYVRTDREGTRYFACQFMRTSFHGIGVLYYPETSRPMLIAEYLDGRRAGKYLVYDVYGRPAIYAEYGTYREPMITVLLVDGVPCMVEGPNRSYTYLIDWVADAPRVYPSTDIDDPRLEKELAEYTVWKEKFWKAVQTDEGEAKREFASWFRDVNEKILRPVIAARSVEARAGIIDAINARGHFQISAHNEIRVQYGGEPLRLNR